MLWLWTHWEYGISKNKKNKNKNKKTNQTVSLRVQAFFGKKGNKEHDFQEAFDH